MHCLRLAAFGLLLPLASPALAAPRVTGANPEAVRLGARESVTVSLRGEALAGVQAAVVKQGRRVMPQFGTRVRPISAEELEVTIAMKSVAAAGSYRLELRKGRHMIAVPLRIEVPGPSQTSPASERLDAVDAGAGPRITGLARRGDGYVILGSGFGADVGAVKVYENNRPLDATVLEEVTPDRIVVASNPARPVAVAVSVGRQRSNASRLGPPETTTVEPAAPPSAATPALPTTPPPLAAPNEPQRADQAASCELAATLVAPEGEVLPPSQRVNWRLEFRNLGAATCPGSALTLRRFTGEGTSGSALIVGGSGGRRRLLDLAPGATTTVTFSERVAPQAGSYTYDLQYRPAIQDGDATNHRIQRTVTFGEPRRYTAPIQPVITRIEPEGDGYSIGGSNFGTDATAVRIYENGKPLDPSSVLAVQSDRILVASKPTRPVGILVEVANVKSVVTIYEPPTPPRATDAGEVATAEVENGQPARLHGHPCDREEFDLELVAIRAPHGLCFNGWDNRLNLIVKRKAPRAACVPPLDPWGVQLYVMGPGDHGPSQSYYTDGHVYVPAGYWLDEFKQRVRRNAQEQAGVKNLAGEAGGQGGLIWNYSASRLPEPGGIAVLPFPRFFLVPGAAGKRVSVRAHVHDGHVGAGSSPEARERVLNNRAVLEADVVEPCPENLTAAWPDAPAPAQPASSPFPAVLAANFNHVRCQTCHGFFDASDSTKPDNHPVVPIPAGNGAAQGCNCHESLIGSEWRAPIPERVASVDLRTADAQQLCEMARSLPSTGSHPTVGEHLTEDPLILWAVERGDVPPPGQPREALPVTHAEWRQAVKDWVLAGCPCPDGSTGSANTCLLNGEAP